MLWCFHCLSENGFCLVSISLEFSVIRKNHMFIVYYKSEAAFKKVLKVKSYFLNLDHVWGLRFNIFHNAAKSKYQSSLGLVMSISGWV